jgi:hypothetical protein
MASQQGAIRTDILVSTSLAVVLTFLAFFSYSYYKNVTHDIVVLSEVAQIRSALEINFVVNTLYPKVEKPVILNVRDQATEKICLSGFTTYSQACGKITMSKIPQAYRMEDYLYYSTPSADNYSLQFILNNNQKYLGLVKGVQCATSESIKSGPCEFPVNKP